MEYVDFEVEIGPGTGDVHPVKVRALGAVANGELRFPFGSLDGDALKTRLQALQIALLRSGGPARRRATTTESDAVGNFGKELWEALFDDEVLARYEATQVVVANSKPPKGLRLKLSFASPELAALPWEYLCNPAGDFVALSVGTPLVRYIEMDKIMSPIEVEPPLRILGMAVSPKDLPALDLDQERHRLDAAVQGLVGEGRIELHWLEGGTRRGLQEALQAGPWHIFHFIGHGGYDELKNEGILVLEGEDGLSRRLSARDVGILLGDHDPLRLAVLNSCESARADRADVFSSTAATLVRRGTPAVVAMQYEITDDAAIEFSRSFYHAIAAGLPVDGSVAEARKSVAGELPDTLEWGTPVLFLRAQDGVLFRITGTPTPVAVPPAPAPTKEDEAKRKAEEEEAARRKAAEEEEAAKRRAAEDEARKKAAEDEATKRRAAEEAARLAAIEEGKRQAQAEASRLAAEDAKRKRRNAVLLLGGAVAAAIAILVAASVLVPSGDTPNLAVSVSEARPGDVVRVSGAGFVPGEAVELRLGDTVLGTLTTDSAGTFVTDVTVPDGNLGSMLLSAEGRFGSMVSRSIILLAAGTPTGAPPTGAPPTVGPTGAPSDTPTEPPPTTLPTDVPVFAGLPFDAMLVNHRDGPDDDYEIFAVHPTTGAFLGQLTDNDVDDRWPAWSPTRAGIAFTRSPKGDTSTGDIYTLDANGEHQLTSGPDNDWYPAWCYGGDFLVFASNRRETDKRLNDLYSIPSNGSAAAPTLLFGEPGVEERGPACSPDWSAIAFSSNQGNPSERGELDIWMLQSDLAVAAIQMTFDPGPERNVSFSPDGSNMAYARAQPGALDAQDIWIYLLRDRINRPVTQNDAFEGNPVFSPEGDRIAFYRRTGEVGQNNFSTSDIVTANLDGSGEQVVTSALGGQNVDASWR